MNRTRLLAALVPVLGLMPIAAGIQPEPPASSRAVSEAHKPEPYQRVHSESPDKVALQMAVREFAPPREGLPTIYLAGAVHIARPEFYAGLQEFLDAQDMVLFEGVKPPGSGDPALDLERAATNEQKARLTGRRVRLVAMAAERYRAEHDGYPTSMKQLREGAERRIADLLKVGVMDAWGNPLIFEAREKGFDVYSLGADNQPGGDGGDADIRYSDQKKLSRAETGDRGDGLQSKLAGALGVVFQLDAMDHNKPNWRNSDLSIDQVQARLERAGADDSGLFSMLSGDSLGSKLVGFVLNMLSARPEDQAKLRIMMIEMISMADQLMDAAPGGMGAMMRVILDDRNEVVLLDLRRLVDSEDPPGTIAVIYGAGHLPAIETALVRELGYRPAGDVWHTAMESDAGSAGMTVRDFTQFRTMIGTMMEKQLEQARKQKNRAAKKRPAASEDEAVPAGDRR